MVLDKPVELPADYNKLSSLWRRRVRETYADKQGGLCYYCKQSLAEEPKQTRRIDWSKFPKGFLNHPVHLHHDHKTGWTLGAVHAYCNAVLWQYHGE